MKHLLGSLLLFGVAFLTGCRTGDGDGTRTNRPLGLADLFSDYHEERMKLYPLEATFAGDTRYNDVLQNDLTEEFREKERVFYTRYLESIQSINQAGLSAEERLSCDALAWECEIKLAQLQFPAHLMPLNQFWSLHLALGAWAGGTSAQPFKTVQDYENWLRRLEGFIGWCDTAITNARAGMKQGYVLPRPLTLKTIPQFTALAKGPVTNHPFHGPIRRLPSKFSARDRDQLANAYETMIGDRLIPAFRRVESFLKDEYLPASRTSSGISAVPKGREYYDVMIRTYTTTTMSADEIHELGRREVARILDEMEKVKQAVGFTGDLKAFFEHTRTRKELMPFTEPKQVVENFHAIHRRMQPQVKRMFALKIKTPFEIRRTEAFRERSASAEYSYGSLDGSRPGIFYVPVPDVREYNMISDESLFLHEAIPGHHYQLSIQRENRSMPMFRRLLEHSSYAEGWALYCESLGKELGLYDDPYQYFGMLSAEMHRAIRLVVDTGLHAKGWTREQAIQYSLEHEAETEAGIVAEIERYMAIPGQALSYKIGQLEIQELRARAERVLGSRFDIREFHTEVLESGCIPLSLLERKVNAWIEAEK